MRKATEKCDKRVRSLLDVVYDFGDAEINALLLLCGAGEARVGEISKLAGKDRSTVQRLLTRLTKAGLVQREARCCTGPKKGRYFVYSLVSPSKLRSRMRARTRQWYLDKMAAIEGFHWPQPDHAQDDQSVSRATNDETGEE
jgi:predicted transcriptional regulator